MDPSAAVIAGKAPDLATLERELELAVIDRVLIEAATGAGVLAIVEGPIGIGKSRVLDEARALAERRKLAVLDARGGELEREYPFGVVLQLFEQPLATMPEDTRARALHGRAALAERLLSGAPGDSAAVTPSDEFALLHALYWLVVNLAEERPLALVVDDLHWVDDLSLRFLHYLAERVADLPVAIVASVRSPRRRSGDDLVARLIDASALAPVRPAELSLDATRRLLANAGLAAAGDENVVQACRRATGGSPLLLRELIVAMRRDPALAATTDPAVIGTLAPRSLESRILPRITSIGSDAVTLARVAALLGDEARLADVAAVAGVGFEAAVRLAEGLLDAAILAEADPPRFAHPMMRTVLYESIPPGERRRLHTAAARVLHEAGAPSERVARHLMEGSPVGDPWAAAALHAAARAAASRGAPAIAAGYLRAGVERLGVGEQRASMLVDLGLLEAATGETTSLARFEAALEVLEDDREQARALYALGQTLYRYGRHDEAIATFRRGADRFTEAGDRDSALGFEAAWACAGTWVAALADDAGPRLTKLASAIPAGDRLTVAERALLAAFSAYSGSSSPPASAGASLAREALADGELLAADGPQSVPMFLALLTLVVTGEFTAAGRGLERVVTEAQARDDALAFAEAAMVRAYLRYLEGRVGEAAADAEAALAGVAVGWRVAPQVARAVLALCHIERGELDAAASVLDEAQAHASKGMVADALLFAARARLRLLRGDIEGALRDCYANRDALAPAGVTNPFVALWRPVAVAALQRQGDADGARALIEEELELASTWGLPTAIGAALRARGALDDGDAGLADLRRSHDVLTDAGAGLESARSGLALGARLHGRGDVEEARDVLREALDLAHTCGATALEAQAREALLAAGARPRRAAISGIAALTPSERRIADLAAAGDTNRAIAESLFLTKNTVEWHLRNIFKKLGVKSRAQLRELLAADA